MPRKNLLWILLVALLAVAVFLVYRNYAGKSGTTSPAARPAGKEQTRFFDPRLGYPSTFVPGLPLDKPLDVLDNSQTKMTDGRVVNSVQYVTADDQAASIRRYKDFFRKNGWAVSNESNGASYYVFQANKLFEAVTYTFSVNTITGRRSVGLLHVHPDNEAISKRIRK